MDKDNKEDNLTPEEIAVNNIINDTSRTTQDIEEQIRNLPSDKGPELRPQGMPGIRKRGDKGLEKYHLQQKLDEVKSKANEKLDTILESSTYQTQLKVHATIDQWRNPEKTIAIREQQEKNITGSQDLAMRKLADVKQHRRDEEKEPAESPEQETVTTSEGKSLSMATTFLQTLGFTQMEQHPEIKSDKSDKSPEIEKDH